MIPRAVVSAAVLSVMACDVSPTLRGDDPSEDRGLASAPFVSDRALDTVAVVGTRDETNPLFLYKQALGALLDGETVVYADNGAEGRMAVVRLTTGEGWEMRSAPGEEGPGEFNGQMPFVYPYDGVIHTITGHQRYNAFDRNGNLLAAKWFREPWFSPLLRGSIAGLVGDRVVIKYQRGEHYEVGQHVLEQGIQLQDAEEGVVMDIRDGIPDLVVRTTLGTTPTSRASTPVAGGGLLARARGGTIAWAMAGGRQVTTLDAEGTRLARRELDHELWDLFIDADQRVWIKVKARDVEGTLGNVVLDRHLRELFRVSALHVQDARGQMVLANGFGPLDEHLLVLLRMRPAGNH